MISVTSSGSFTVDAFLAKLSKGDLFATLNRYGAMGVDALASATPVDSHLTASSWTYKVVKKKGFYAIYWNNTNMADGVPIAIILQYGHATGTGGWVEGRDYINPAIQPLFDQMADEAWKQVTDG
jgi:hypothetical protein